MKIIKIVKKVNNYGQEMWACKFSGEEGEAMKEIMGSNVIETPYFTTKPLRLVMQSIAELNQEHAILTDY